MATAEDRLRPNILVTGTPGTGKTTLASQIAQKLHFEHIDIGQEIKQQDLHSGFDPEYNCHILDEDKLLDHLEEKLDSIEGGYVLDYHGSDFFPERWFDLVLVLRCDNTILYDRLKARNYTEKKLRENVECEIFGTLLEEAQDSYKQELIWELNSDSVEQMEENLEKIVSWALEWKNKQANSMEGL